MEKNKNKNQLEIEIKIEGQEWQDALDKAYETASKKVKIDGFRPGKAPKEVFFKKYKKEALYLDAADLVIQDAYKKMMEEHKDLDIVAQPEGNLKAVSDEYVEFIFVLTTKPEVKLGNYKNLGVKKEKIEITKEEIEKAADQVREKYAETVVKDSAIEEGDTAVINFEGFKDGVPFEGGKGEAYPLTIGSHTFIPGFEEQLIGVKPNSEVDVKVTFPEDYHSEDLKGKEVVFKVKVNEVKGNVLPEYNKEFFEDLGMEGVDSKEALERQLEENIRTHKEAHAEDHYVDEILEKAVANMEVEIPDPMINDELDRMIRQYSENLKMQGITLEQFYQFTNSDEQALKDQMKEEATKRVSERLLLEAIKDAEKVSIEDAEVETEAEALAQKYQMEKAEFLNLFGGLDMVRYDLEMRKAIEILKENN